MSKPTKSLPTDKESQLCVMKEVDKIVDAKLEIKSLLDLIDDSAEYCKEKYGVDKSYVKAISALKYDIVFDERKKADKIAEQAELVEFVEGL